MERAHGTLGGVMECAVRRETRDDGVHGADGESVWRHSVAAVSWSTLWSGCARMGRQGGKSG